MGNAAGSEFLIDEKGIIIAVAPSVEEIKKLLNKNEVKERPAYNKRFDEIGVKVITRISARPLTVSDNPNGAQSSPNFAKPPGRCTQASLLRDKTLPIDSLGSNHNQNSNS